MGEDSRAITQRYAGRMPYHARTLYHASTPYPESTLCHAYMHFSPRCYTPAHAASHLALPPLNPVPDIMPMTLGSCLSSNF